MATYLLPVRINNIESTVTPDLVSNQITTSNPIGNFKCYVMNDGGADEGVYAQFTVPQNYVGTGAIIVGGILDGAPGAAEVLGFGITGLSVANNETVDAAFSTQDIASATIGSGGLNYSDEDQLMMSIALSNLTGLAAGESVYLYVFLDASVTTYGGNFLLTSITFSYADA